MGCGCGSKKEFTELVTQPDYGVILYFIIL